MNAVFALATSLVLAAVTLALAPASADHPVPCVEAVDGTSTVLLSRGIPPPYCNRIASGERVTWRSVDAIGPHDPRDIRTSGSCFSALDAELGYLRLGQSFTMQFTWDEGEGNLRVRGWDTDGRPVRWYDTEGRRVDEKRCWSSVAIDQPDGSLLLPWASFQTPGHVVIAR